MRRSATTGMALHVFQDSCDSKTQFVIPMEHKVNQQCGSTNASIVVSSAVTTSKPQLPEHILLPEHSNHLTYRAMGSVNLFGWGGERRIEATRENDRP